MSVAPNHGTKSHLGTGKEVHGEEKETKCLFWNIFQTSPWTAEKSFPLSSYCNTCIGNKWVNEISEDLPQEGSLTSEEEGPTA